MSYTQAQPDALREAVASGVREVTYEGKTVKYATQAEMLQLIGIMERALGQAAPTQHYPRFSKGL
jgi:hypothetical protein